MSEELIRNVIRDLRERYNCNSYMDMGYEEGFSPEERMSKAANDLEKILNTKGAMKKVRTDAQIDADIAMMVAQNNYYNNPMNDSGKYIMTCNLKVKRLDPNLPLPSYSRDGDACLDLYATAGGVVLREDADILGTGIAIAIPPGYVGIVRGRSGTAFNYGIEIHHGVIDSNFRGELKVKVFNNTKFNYKYNRGDRIAQLMVLPLPTLNVIEVDDLDETNRGVEGFGSSGV